VYLHQAPRLHWGERHSQHPVPCKGLVCLTDLLSQKETRELPLRSGPAGGSDRGAGECGYICMAALETGHVLRSSSLSAALGTAGAGMGFGGAGPLAGG